MTFHLTRGTHRVTTTSARERTQLRAYGYRLHDDEASAAAAVAQAREEADARAAAAAAQDEGDPSGLPARSASKSDWRDFALANGLDEGHVDALTRADLAAHYHDGTELPAAPAAGDDAGSA